jgi:hypothetical protein
VVHCWPGIEAHWLLGFLCWRGFEKAWLQAWLDVMGLTSRDWLDATQCGETGHCVIRTYFHSVEYETD